MSRKTIKIKYGIEMKEPRRIPPWLKMLIILGAVVLGIYLSYHFVVWVLTPTEEDIMIMEATPTERVTTLPPTVPVTPTPTVRPSPTVNPEMSYDLTMATQTGDHIKGWVNIPGLGLDTVIVQWTDNEFFREADINLDDGRVSGAVFFDYRSDFSYILDAGNIVIYGNNNLGGRQLKSMVQYVQKGKLNYYQTIVLETLYGSYNFRPFSVHIEDDDSPYTIPVTNENRKEFIDMLMEKTMVIPDEFPDEDSVILTFSIDVESEKGSRLLIHAFLKDY